MSKEEEQYDYTGEAIKAAKKAEAKAKAKAAASGTAPEPPKLTAVVGAALDMLARRGSKPAPEDVIRNPNLLFARAMNESALSRFRARQSAYEFRYAARPAAEIQGDLINTWNVAEANNVAPKDILKNLPKKNITDLAHPVAMELVAHETALTFDKKFGEDPRLWFQELERAYQSIDFSKLDAKGAAELRAVFTASFDQIRGISKNVPLLEVPEQNDGFWRSLGDYYLSEGVPDDIAPPVGVNAGTWIKERDEFNSYLRDLQNKLGRPHTHDQEKKILEDAQYELNKGLDANRWVNFKDRAERTQYRLTKEIEGYASGGRGEGFGKGEPAEEQAARVRAAEFIPNRPHDDQYFMLPHLDRAVAEFQDSPGALNSFLELDKLFEKKTNSVLWDSMESTRLGRANKMLNDIELQFPGGMKEGQQKIIDGYRRDIAHRLETASRYEDAPNRIYLLRQEKEGLDNAPFGTMEQMFLEAMQAHIKDPNGPRAKFLFDRLELAEYYVFSKQHSEKMVELFIVDNEAELWKAVETGSGIVHGELIGGEQLAAQMAFIDQKYAAVAREKENYERVLTSRLHEVIYQQQWKHTDEYSNEQWVKFINSGLQEDDYWGMDGHFGNLAKIVRMKLKTKVEGKMFDENGNTVAHMARLNDEALRDLIVDLQDEEKHPELVQTWNEYMSGAYFTDAPGSGKKSMLGYRKPGTRAMSYHDGIEVVANFAKYRMIMSDEEYILDSRFDPIGVGVDRGEIELPEGPLEVVTQFLEKQKVVKLFQPYNAQIRTWGGITLGATPTEKIEFREQAEILTNAFPEINSWAKEWADTWWQTKVEKFLHFDAAAYEHLSKAEKDQYQYDYGDIKSLYVLSVDDFDKPPKIVNFEDVASAKKASDWIKRNLHRKGFDAEVRFNAGMTISDMVWGEAIYMGAFESGARRNASFSMLKEVLGGREDLAEQNFLTYVELQSSQEYFGKKQTSDTKERKEAFLKKWDFISRYEPQSPLLTLREGKSKSLEAWVAANVQDGKRGFRKFYTELSEPYEDISNKLKMHEQIDYSKGAANDEQREAAWSVFLDRNKGDEGLAKTDMARYFKQMRDVTDYLIKEEVYGQIPGAIAAKNRFGKGAIAELTDIRYGPRLWRMRRDDFPSEYLQYPERALTKLMQIEGHPLYDAKAAQIISQKTAAQRVLLNAQRSSAQAKQSGNQAKLTAADLDIKNATDQLDGLNILLQPYILGPNGVLEKIKNGTSQRLRERFLTRVTDKFEPQTSQDEQSGLFRRNKRDENGIAQTFQLIKPAMSMSNEKGALEAQQKIYETHVGISGNTVATNIIDLIAGERLAVQLAYRTHRPFFIGWQDSSPLKKMNSSYESKLPDQLLHEWELHKRVTGDRARYSTLDSLGMEYAVKKRLNITNYNGIFGGTTGREEFVESVKDIPILNRIITHKRAEDFVEWLDHHAPLGVWSNNVAVGTGVALLFFGIYIFQTAGSGGKDKHKEE